MGQLVAPRKAASPAPSRRDVPVLPVALSVVAALAIAGIVGAFVVLPAVLKQRCIAIAASQGVTLSVDHVAVGIGEVQLVKVGVALDGVPQISGTADDVRVTLSGLTPADSTADGFALTMDGPLEDIEKALGAWSAAQARCTTAGAAASVHPISWALGRLTWTRAFGQDAKVELSNVSGGIDPAKRTARMLSDHATLTAGHETFGPWRVDIERDPQTSRADVELDPVVQGGPSVVYVHDASEAISVRARIARSPLAHLGIPPKTVSMAADTVLEASADFDEARAGASTLKGSLTLGGVQFAGVPMQVKVDLSASGDRTKGLDVKQGTFSAGPLHGAVSGTLQLFDDGARLALAWRSAGIPCSEVGKQLATQALGQLGSQLGALAADVGEAVGVRVSGDATASGLVTIDSRDLAGTTFSMTSNQTCGLALF